jgi:hypothetical protein
MATTDTGHLDARDNNRVMEKFSPSFSFASDLSLARERRKKTSKRERRREERMK